MEVPLFKVYSAPGSGEALQRILDTGYIGQGPQVDAFESALHGFWGRGDPVATSSGTAALDLAYHLASTPLGRVLTSPLTCTATNLPLLHRGFEIEWYDVDATGCASADDVLRRSNTDDPPEFIVLVSWAGRNLAPLCRKIRSGLKHSIPIIVDYAHSAPLPPPLLADYTCYSFQAIKHLTTGDGGALVCANVEDTKRARLLRWYGLDRTSSRDFRCSQDIVDPGFKYHMNDLAATLGLWNLFGGDPGGEGSAPLSLRHRWRLHTLVAQTLYTRLHEEIPWLQSTPFDPESAHWLYPVLYAGDRDALLAHLNANGVAAGRVHRRNDTHPCFANAPAWRQGARESAAAVLCADGSGPSGTPRSPRGGGSPSPAALYSGVEGAPAIRAVEPEALPSPEGKAGPGPGFLPGLDLFDSHQLNLPCGWWVTKEAVDHIVNTLKSFRP